MSNVVNQFETEHSILYHGDCVDVAKGLPADSVGLIVTSIPFPMMYAYSNHPRDIGNTKNTKEMLEHYRFLISGDNLLRVLKPGRMMIVHLTQPQMFKHRDGHIGLYDFRGDVIRLHESLGWHFYGEVTVGKDPQVRAQRTKDSTLQFKSLATDSARMRPAIADYLVIFRKPGDNPDPIPAGISDRYGNKDGWITDIEWIEWANPIWLGAHQVKGGIEETNTLNVAAARSEDDERHLCPLQLDLIERCVKLWSAPGEVVMDPFNGVGSVGYVAIQQRRRYVGSELKPEYFKQACKNLRIAEDSIRQSSFLDLIGAAQ